ncbi:GATA zinc finger domain-containing protein 7 isoform X1 [Drosophila navojoa]|uniref:GATA zinc finger domain-containing protein 7 isoform X1 n=1 Tax=Drosophila navojoa TaxID=7232 RepID=UPI0008463496|nr:GATA zinc finger domain-containing protein 7 isoform X1 [Drosophila navojoa]
MVSKTLLLLLAIVAARFGSSTRRSTLALAFEESRLQDAANNRYNSYYSSNENDYGNIDGIVDNDNKATAKWQQKLYANSQEQLQQPEQPEEPQQQQFVDDPEAARNDFLSQLSDLNAAVQGAGMFAAQQSNSNSNNDSDNNNNNNYDNNVWQAAAEFEGEETHLPQKRHSRGSYMNRYAAEVAGGAGGAAAAVGQPERYEMPSETSDDDVDIEGEEDYAVGTMDADELSDQLPYGIQNVRKRRVRSVLPPPLSAQQQSGDVGVTYQSLCPTKRVTVKLDNGEYRPNHYVEVTCDSNYAPLPARLHSYDSYHNNELPLLRALRAGVKREICSTAGFSCIQLNRTIHLIRLNEGSGCWESETRTVPSGCECMWPKHSYGDIATYHQAQKRFRNTPSKFQAGVAAGNVDYKPGTGYRQLTLRTRKPKARAGAGTRAAAAGRSRREDVLDYENYELI